MEPVRDDLEEGYGLGTAVAPASERRELGPASDHALVAAVRRGDDRAFETLYARYQRRIAAYVYGMVNDYGRAEDITQDVFISALRRMRETERPIAFKPWIYEIAKNACIDQFRRSRRAEEVSYDAEDGAGAVESARLAAPGATPDAAVDAKQQLDVLCGAFGGLSETHHQILVMRELEGLSYREIGERMGLSRPSVESTLFRARRRLTEEYDELISGQRCVRIQTIIANVAEGSLGTRDQRRLARHIAHCQPCRREARLAGLDAATFSRSARQSVAAKVAALLPFPAIFRGRRGGGASLSDGAGSNLMAHWSGTLASMGEPLAGWGKAAIAAAAVVLAGGAGVAGHELTKGPSGDAPGAGDSAVVKPGSAARTKEQAVSNTAVLKAQGTAGTTKRVGRGNPSTTTSDRNSGAGGSTPAAGGGSGSGGSGGGGAHAPDSGGTAGGASLPSAGGGQPSAPSVPTPDGKPNPPVVSVPSSPPVVNTGADPAAEAQKLGTQVDPAVGDAIGGATDTLGSVGGLLGGGGGG